MLQKLTDDVLDRTKDGEYDDKTLLFCWVSALMLTCLLSPV